MKKTIIKQDLVKKKEIDNRINNFFGRLSVRNIDLLENPGYYTDWNKFNRELELFLVRNRCKWDYYTDDTNKENK